jgi:hypothetical protein
VTTGRDEIAEAWHDARAAGLHSSGGMVTTTWNRPLMAVGIAALLWVIAAVLF